MERTGGVSAEQLEAALAEGSQAAHTGVAAHAACPHRGPGAALAALRRSWVIGFVGERQAIAAARAAVDSGNKPG